MAFSISIFFMPGLRGRQPLACDYSPLKEFYVRWDELVDMTIKQGFPQNSNIFCVLRKLLVPIRKLIGSILNQSDHLLCCISNNYAHGSTQWIFHALSENKKTQVQENGQEDQEKNKIMQVLSVAHFQYLLIRTQAMLFFKDHYRPGSVHAPCTWW